ncbi:unnamed protein product [Adineta steineri]|uniref:G-protein coupled receptors family 1 profile domain-containing protein n=2 Tax=Adineta steineri TaxID=433720 RepID=A0A814X6V4_9BILA|nr:unnamed protein product [Adineta steineri]
MYFVGLSTRILLDDGYQLSFSGVHSDIYCKIRTYFVYVYFAISNWFFVCASLDRFYSTNQSAVQRQHFCSTRMAFKFICAAIIGCLLVHFHVIIFYSYFNVLNQYNRLTLSCTAIDIVYNIFFAFFMLIFFSFLPPVLMSIIGFLTLNNIRKTRRHVNPTNTTQIKVRRDRNQLIKSLLIQITILVVLTTPHTCYWFYIAFTANESSTKTNCVRAWEKLILTIARLLLYINYGSTFYTQIIISKTFKKEFIKIFDNLINVHNDQQRSINELKEARNNLMNVSTIENPILWNALLDNVQARAAELSEIYTKLKLLEETFPEQIDCGEQLIIIMSILLPFCIIFSLLICWIIKPYPHQASNVIEFQCRQEKNIEISDD